ncbi:RDD family protein [Rhizobiaceae bacterium]|nr:RDD family protein [Rhizobiaceae bacterium]
MTTATQDPVTTADHHMIPAERLRSVRTARLLAFFVDYAIILVLSIPAAVVVGLLGIITLGLAWGLYALMIPAIAVAYVAFTMGGEKQATIGMRMTGVRVFKLGGGRVDPLLAALHHVLFLAIQGFGLLLPLVVTLFSSKKRLLHDIALGTYVARD